MSASYQDLHGRRLDGDVDGIQVRLLDVFYPLKVYIQNADQVLGLNVFYG